MANFYTYRNNIYIINNISYLANIKKVYYCDKMYGMGVIQIVLKCKLRKKRGVLKGSGDNR